MTNAHNEVSRRDMLKFTAAGAVVAGLPRLSAWANVAMAAKPGIALQLYSVRDDLREGLRSRAGNSCQDGIRGRGIRWIPLVCG